MRNAKIVCTLGPASDDRESIARLAEAGMTVARLNASHGDRSARAGLLDRVREVGATVDGPLATMLDLQGPEVRSAPLEAPVTLAEGSAIRFVEGETVRSGADAASRPGAATTSRGEDEPVVQTGEVPGAASTVVGLSVPLTGVEPGDRVLLDDGRIETVVTDVDEAGVTARVEAGGTLGSRTGVNVPGVELDVAAITEADRRELELAAEHGVDFVAASFVTTGDDVLAINEVLESLDVRIPIVAKIERDAAVANLESIVEAAYAVMVARGDLGVECPLEEVPLIQKRIVRHCRAAGVPVIIATEMLDSMVHRRRPTRAEASDVANAVLDGADAVMLSGETAVGAHPVAVVETMDRIVREVEGSGEYRELTEQRVPAADHASTEALARSARYLARDVGASAIVVASESGYTALKAAKFRPAVPVVATTPSERVRRQLSLSWGVTVEHAVLATDGAAAVVENAVGAALASGAVESGDTVVVVTGMMTDVDRSTTNTLKVHVAAERLAAGMGVVAGRAAGPLVRSVDGDLTGLPPGAVLYLPASFEGELVGDVDRLAGVVHERAGMTGYPAMVARELGIPMASGVTLAGDLEDEVVTVDGDRGVVYAGDVTRNRRARESAAGGRED